MRWVLLAWSYNVLHLHLHLHLHLLSAAGAVDDSGTLVFAGFLPAKAGEREHRAAVLLEVLPH